MFIFNTTFVVSHNKFSDWQYWLNNTYKPLFKTLLPACEVNAFEVLSNDKGDHKTISVQWKVSTPSELETINKQSPTVLGQMATEFGQEAVYFSTILKSI